MGFVADNFYATKIGRIFGRRRFWILLAIPMMIAEPLIFVATPFGFPYYFVLYLIYNVAYTFCTANLSPLTIEMTDDFKERTYLTGYKHLFGNAAGFLMAALVGFGFGTFGETNPFSYFIIATVNASVMAISLLCVYLSTWEHTPEEVAQEKIESFSTYCSTFTGLSVHDVCIYGRGAIDGQTDFAEDNWWNKDFKNIFRPEEGREVARPRMIFLSECENVSLAGFTVRNSPAWNIHPILCEHVDALCLSIEGPKNSHNTDGFDPESCGFVRILGCQFSVGDDCIAIKCGKLGIEPELRPATHDVLISHCYMHDGHGAVVLGSEAAGGIKDLTVSKCLFERTDRGLRVKTRRGRGKDAVNEGITFEHIRMDEVLTPFVVNSFYFCDKDGKTDYVQSREALPVDDRTPGFGATTFCDIEATNCHAAAAYITGLPESKVTRLTFQDVHVTFADDAEPFVPAMACGVEPMVRQGIIAQNVKVLDLQNVVIEGQDGEELQLQNVDKVVRA